MAIVQISKIQHRTGANVDLPQLDIGEIGFATDEQRVYIGNDPTIVPPVGLGATTQTEILTTASPLDFSRLTGSSNSYLELTSPEAGQLLGVSVTSNIATVVNVGGNAGGEITLGAVSDVKLDGGVNGFVLQTDGTGNLSWTTNGTLSYKILSLTDAGSGNTLITTNSEHYFGTGTSVTISGSLPSGTIANSIQTAGFSGTNQFWTARVSNTTFTIHDGSNVADAGSKIAYNALWSGYTANSGTIVGQITPSGNAVPGGANTQLQFNDTGGAFGGDSNLTYDKSTGILALTGNFDVTGYVNGAVVGYFDGEVGSGTANIATFTSVTINNNLDVGGYITTTYVSANSNGAGENYKVGNDIWIGDVDIVNTMQLKGVTNSANAYIIFGDSDTSTLGRSGTGPLTYDGDFEANGNVTASNINLSTWSMFANIDGLFATDGSNTYSIDITPV
jgi:hypothetical protein